MVNAHFGPEVWGRSAAPKEMFVCVCVFGTAEMSSVMYLPIFSNPQ